MKLLILLFIFSVINPFSQRIPGTYITQGIDYKYELILSPDSTFSFNESFWKNTNCKGKWMVIGDTILLKCIEATIEEKLQRGYIIAREQKLIILQAGNLRLNAITLKRQD